MTSDAFRNVSASPAGGPHSCPCCGHRTLLERGGYDICGECGWEDDGQDNHDSAEVRGGPNGNLSLDDARAAYVAGGGRPQPHMPHAVRYRADERVLRTVGSKLHPVLGWIWSSTLWNNTFGPWVERRRHGKFGAGSIVSLLIGVNFGHQGEPFLPSRVVLDPSGPVVLSSFLDDAGRPRELAGPQHPVADVEWRDQSRDDNTFGLRSDDRIATVTLADGMCFEVACHGLQEALLDTALRRG